MAVSLNAVRDVKTITKLLKELIEKKPVLYLFDQEKKVAFNSHVIRIDKGPNLVLDVPKKVSVGNTKPLELYANFKTDDDLFLIAFKVKHFRETEIVTEDFKIFKQNRRQSYRYKIPDREEFFCTSPQLLRKNTHLKIYDISAEGISFFIREDQKSNFPKGELIEDLETVLNGKEVVFDAEVRSFTPLKNGIKMGLIFKKFGHQAQAIVFSFINLRSNLPK